MKYHPVNGEKYLNRDYLGKFWNRKYIRAIQTILNATKGKIGKGVSFFYEAFGKNIEEFNEILIMPETYILYRFFFRAIGYTKSWQDEFKNLTSYQKEKAIQIIKSNDFKNLEQYTKNKTIISFIQKHYTFSRSEISNPNSVIYKLKKEFDKNCKRNKEFQFLSSF
jgi:hypothetical protein